MFKNVKNKALDLSDPILTNVLRMERYSKSIVPVKHGHLKRSIRGSLINKQTGLFEAGVEYAGYVEEMWKKGIRKGRKTGQMPFMDPSVKKYIPELRKDIVKHISQERQEAYV